MEYRIGLLVAFFVFALIYLAYSVVTYVLQSKGLHAIAQRRGIHNPWLAWVPVANFWVFGSVSDQYRLQKYGYDPELRRTLLILGIVAQAGAILINSVNLYNNTILYGSLAMAPVLLLLIV